MHFKLHNESSDVRWSWKCFYRAEIKMNWRYLHCISY